MSAAGGDGAALDACGVQLAGVIDSLFATGGCARTSVCQRRQRARAPPRRVCLPGGGSGSTNGSIMFCEWVMRMFDEYSGQRVSVRRASTTYPCPPPDQPLGHHWCPRRGRHVISVWAPTAASVQLLHWRGPRGGGAGEAHAMVRDEKGVWSLERPDDWDRT